MAKKETEIVNTSFENEYSEILKSSIELFEQARHLSIRSVNAFMTASYWEFGRRIVQLEQGGKGRAEYGKQLLKRLAKDLTKEMGRGFGEVNLSQMRKLYLTWGKHKIFQTMSEKFGLIDIAKMSEKFGLIDIAKGFPLPWSHYVLLLSCKNENARKFYEDESLRGGWTVRQLKRQINSKFYERTALSKDKVAMLKKGEKPLPEDYVSPEEEIKDSFVLEFLGLKDEYSELQLEEAIIKHLENFLLELGAGFAFVGRQMRLRVGDEWYRVDLVLFNRRLRCLVIIDLKLGKLTHADIGQMLLYTGYANEHWQMEGENPPIGLILCDQNNTALAHYTLENLPNKILASEYRMILPSEEVLIEEINKAKRLIGK